MRLLFLVTIVLSLVAVSVNAQPTAVDTFRTIADNWFAVLERAISYVRTFVQQSADNCKIYDCPKYDVKRKGDGYELRCYKAYVWISTSNKGKNLTIEMRRKHDMLLKNYLSGANEDKKKIPMALPIVRKSRMGSVMNLYTTFFFIPFKYQKQQLPKPTNREVSIQHLSPFCVYVRGYSGDFTMEREDINLKELKTSLDHDKIDDYTAPKVMHCSAQYYIPKNSPQVKKLNEVWLLQKPKPTATL